MSGRLHIFLHPDQQKQVDEMVKELSINDHEYGPRHGVSHLFQCAVEEMLDLLKKDQLEPNYRELLAEVPEQVSVPDTCVFLKQSNVDKCLDWVTKLGIADNDFAMGHLAQIAFTRLYASWKHNLLSTEQLNKLKNVIKPKSVYNL